MSGVLTGAGTLKVSGSMTVEGGPEWQGSGSVLVLPGATAQYVRRHICRLEGKRLVNEGTVTWNLWKAPRS